MFERDVKLSQFSSYKIGGPARFFYAPKNIDKLILGVERAKKEKLPVFVLGGGTNLVINDSGFSGLVLKLSFDRVQSEDLIITADAGVLISDLLEFAARRGLSGLEWAGGLPGTLGGAVRGNAGAFGGEIKDSIAEVASLDISGKTPRVLKRKNSECGFGYRTSVFKKENGKEMVLSASLRLKKGNKARIQAAVEEKIAYRKARQPLDYPNIGSIFKNLEVKLAPAKWQKAWARVVKTDPFPVIPTAHIVSEAGLKGVSFGGAMISPKHPNFIVNVLNASAEDVKTLIAFVKRAVERKYDIALEEEVIYI